MKQTKCYHQFFKDQICEIFLIYTSKCTHKFVYLVQQCTCCPQITDKFMKNPNEILVKSEEITLEGIKQFYLGEHTKVGRQQLYLI